MRYIRYYLPLLAGLLLLVTALTNFALAGDPLKEDEDFLYGDPDKDEVPTWEEFFFGIDPYNADSDNDGLPDRWEIDNEMDPSTSSDAHMDNDYNPTTNFSVGEREANFDAIKALGDGTQMTWPSNHEILFVQPVFEEDGPHYDNYEEYYRPYRDQYDNMKIKIMKTKPFMPDTDGDGVLDPDDYEPFNFENDGTGVGAVDSPEIVTNKEVKAEQLPNQDNNENGNVLVEFNEASFQYDFTTAPVTPVQPLGDNKKQLTDAENDGI